MRTATKTATAVLLALAALGGCAKCPTEVVPLEEIISAYNANASVMPRLWGYVKIRVTFPGPGGLPVSWGSTLPAASPNGLLLLSKNAQAPQGPHDFVLIGRETASVELFRIGSSVEQGAYYMWYRFGSNAGCWWGRHRFAGAPGVIALPIDPNQLLAVLGAVELPADLSQPPLVALSMVDQPGDLCRATRCEYALTYLDRQPVSRKILFRREIYLPWLHDRKVPSRPTHLAFFDNDGRRIMHARLDDYRPVKITGPGTKEGDSAVVPTDIQIEWPMRHSSVHIVLTEMSTKHWYPEAANLFDEDGEIGAFRSDQVTQVDKHLEASEK
ncbi:MAG: hypothetical protein BWX88_02480 [Planctomycetes bacterium ADurb.Bin126]|nr:MAG: hypothetical protein BWX88_02480 [Planctomycetes bacterium ADurb.Bin126]HOD83130.1 hypothetical protein [Phycisphaerae bacterium]HQL72477.1 hypothetical protein [Phycisphaerae bacterium]